MRVVLKYTADKDRRQTFSEYFLRWCLGTGGYMANDTDIDELKAKKLCCQCVGEEYLKAEVQSIGKHGKCSYCGQNARSYTIGKMAERVETAFEQHFIRTSDQPTSVHIL